MEDVLGEEWVLQASEIELEDSCYGIHVVVILVPSQGIFPFGARREEQARKIRILEDSTETLAGCNSAGEKDLC